MRSVECCASPGSLGRDIAALRRAMEGRREAAEGAKRAGQLKATQEALEAAERGVGQLAAAMEQRMGGGLEAGRARLFAHMAHMADVMHCMAPLIDMVGPAQVSPLNPRCSALPPLHARRLGACGSAPFCDACTGCVSPATLLRQVSGCMLADDAEHEPSQCTACI